MGPPGGGLRGEAAAARIVLAWIGKTRDRGMRELMERYVDRAARLVPVEVRELRGSRSAEADRKRREDMETLREAASGADTVLVTERGKPWSTAELTAYLAAQVDRGSRPTWFLAGGEDGFRAEDEAWAMRRLSLSAMTLPHELARVILAEQVYRSLSILRQGKYHR